MGSMKSRLEAIKGLLGKVSDKELALEHGLPLADVRAYRRFLGIEPFNAREFRRAQTQERHKIWRGMLDTFRDAGMDRAEIRDAARDGGIAMSFTDNYLRDHLPGAGWTEPRKPGGPSYTAATLRAWLAGHSLDAKAAAAELDIEAGELARWASLEDEHPVPLWLAYACFGYTMHKRDSTKQ